MVKEKDNKDIESCKSYTHTDKILPKLNLTKYYKVNNPTQITLDLKKKFGEIIQLSFDIKINLRVSSSDSNVNASVLEYFLII